MNLVTPSTLLLFALAAAALPACAVESSPTAPSSAEPASAREPLRDDLLTIVPRCRADVVPSSGTIGCYQPTQPHVPAELTGMVSGYGDPSYAGTCSHRATFEAPVARCGSETGWVQNLSIEATSYLSSTPLSQSLCTASYIDYTVSIESASGTWSTFASGRAQGDYQGGNCFLGYSGEVGDYGGSIIDVEISADSYLVQPGPITLYTPEGVSFFVAPDGQAL